MTNEITESFPQTRQDVSNLKNTAMDAARDLSSTASVHAKKAQGHLQDLATHAQEEGAQRVDWAKGKATDLVGDLREYVAARPLASIAACLAIGFVIGLSRRSSRTE